MTRNDAWDGGVEREALKALLEGWRCRVQHKANPLHVYCRLVDLGMGRFLSRKVCVFYERLVYSGGRREWNRD
jgi:hypothetical protein